MLLLMMLLLRLTLLFKLFLEVAAALLMLNLYWFFFTQSTKQLVISQVSVERAVQETALEVNEEGSEAAAATAAFGFRMARPLFHERFVADHPFAYLIYDKTSDTILFFGVFVDPSLE